MTLPRAEPVGFDANRLSPAQRRTAWLPVAITAAVGLVWWLAL
jgi:hypothetical protein